MRYFLIIVFASAFVVPCNAEEPKHEERVTMQTFDVNNNTYSGIIQIIATPCPDNPYNVIINFSDARNSDDAKAKFKAQIDKIVSDIGNAADKCRSH